MEIREIIVKTFEDAFAERRLDPPSPVKDDLILLQSGLDSLAFATIVTDLDTELGYDPFILMEEPVYPRTFGEFTAIYQRFAQHRRQ